MKGNARLRRKKQRRERGVALIMVMGAIAVLTVMLADFQDDAGAEFASATADRDSVQAEYMAKSAVNLSRLLIATEPTIRQAIAPLFMLLRRNAPQLPVWNFSDRLLGAFNDSEGAKDFAATTGVDLSLGKNLGLPGGRFELKIIDEDSKININLGASSNAFAHIRIASEVLGLMAPPANNPLFEQKDATGNFNDRFQICSALIDWADPDENRFNCDLSQNASSSGGVEDDTLYQLMKRPYKRKNAAYDSLDELHMVRGVGDDFWATFVDPSPGQPEKRNLTVWGQGAVNVNTASAQTLLALICSDPDTRLSETCQDPAQSGIFLMGVTMARGVSMGAPLFAPPQDFIATLKGQGMLGPLLASIGLKPIKFRAEGEFVKALTTESKMFSIYAIGIVKGYKRETRTQVHAVVDFRGAPAPGALTTAALTGSLPGTSGASSSTPNPQASANLPQGAGPDAIAAAMRPSTGGQIVFYKIE